MPYAIRKTYKKNCFKVYNKNTKKVFAKCSTRKNAEKQMSLLRALQNNKNFVPNSRRKTQKKQ